MLMLRIKHRVSCDVIGKLNSSYKSNAIPFINNYILFIQTTITLLLLTNGHLGQDELHVAQPLGEPLVVVGLEVQARFKGWL
jgi:hypothetical protein